MMAVMNQHAQMRREIRVNRAEGKWDDCVGCSRFEVVWKRMVTSSRSTNGRRSFDLRVRWIDSSRNGRFPEKPKKIDQFQIISFNELGLRGGGWIRFWMRSIISSDCSQLSLIVSCLFDNERWKCSFPRSPENLEQNKQPTPPTTVQQQQQQQQ